MLNNNKKIKILFVEDIPEDLELAIFQINKSKIEFVHKRVDNKKDFLFEIKNFDPDIIISDYAMPSFTGMDVLKLTQQIKPIIPVIILTGSMNEETAVECMKEGAADYVIKEHIKRIGPAIINALEQADAKRQRIDAYNKLKENEEKFRLVFEAANVGKALILLTGEITVNKAFCDMLGYKQYELINKKWQDITPPEDVKKIEGYLSQLISGVKDTTRFESRYVHKNGSDIWTDVSVSVRRDNFGLPLYFIVTLVDITEKKNAELELKQKTEKLSKLLNISLALNESVEKGIVLQKIVDSSVELTGLDSAAIYLIDESNLYLELAATSPILSENYPEEFKKAKLEHHLHIKETIQKSSIVIIHDTSKEELSEQEKIIVNASNFRTLIYLPLINQYKVVGVIILGTVNRLHLFTDEEINLCLTLASLSALSLTNAMLFEKINQNIIELKNAIQEKERATISLISSEEKFRNIFQNHSAVKLIIDPDDGKIFDANLSAASFYGWSIDELKSMDISQINTLPPEELKREMQKENEAKKTHFEFKHRKADGSIVDVEVFSSSVNIAGKEYLHSIIHDITEKKKAEEQIKLLNQAIEQSSVSVMITDAEGYLIYVNPFFTELTGYEREEVIGRNPRFLKSGHQSLEFYRDLWQTILSGKIWNGELRNKKKNGELYWEKATISPILNKKGIITHFVAIKEDITERKKILEDLIIAKEKAEEMNKIKSNFFANMSHELRTPFIGIMGYAELLLDSLIDEDSKEMVRGILDASNRMKETLTQILNLSKYESENFEVNKTWFDVNEITKYIIKMYEGACIRKNIDLRLFVNVKDGLIYSDKELLIGIINNLVNNAVTFTSRGSVELKIEKIEKNNSDFLMIKVSDTGIGIPENKREIIWEPFRQVSEGFTREYQGTGLGLSIVSKCVELLGGTRHLESEVGKGSVFTIEIPLAKESSSTPDGYANQSHILGNHTLQKDQKLKTKKLLYVEDDNMTLDIVKRMLAGFYEVDLASNSQQALHLLKNNYYDAVLVDINLGDGINGLALTDEIRKLSAYKTVPIIAVTAYASENDRKEFISKGMDYYIAKPFGKKELIKLLNSVFADR